MSAPDRAELGGRDLPGSSDVLRERIVARHAVRLHCVLILCACFGMGLLVTRLLLLAGVEAMWVRYTVALVAAYLTFLLGVRIWLRYAGFDQPVLPSRRAGGRGNYDIPDVIGDGNVSGRAGSAIFRGGGGQSGGGGASLKFDGPAGASESQAQSLVAASSRSSSNSASSSSWGSFDVDDGIVLVALIAVVLAISGAAVYLIYAAPTILADAAFAALLSAGLVKSTKRIATGHWVTSVVGHTWVAFGVVFVLALAFALVAQHYYPEARTVGDVLRRL